jgi:adenylate cyclase
VRTAHQGEAALEMLRTFTPYLILTDLMMPGMSGLELIQKVRQDDRLRSIPVVLLTAKVDDETRIEGVEQGADAYLGKPFNDRELIAEVRNLLALKANERHVAELNTYLTKSVLGRFLPPTMVEKAARGELALELQPEPRLVTILFTDIVGFTPLSMQLEAQGTAQLLNEYLAAMGQVVFANGGTIDKFIGDAVLALFGAPEELPAKEQAQRAIATAREMHRTLTQLNQDWAQAQLPQLQFRCGIHQGYAVVGLFGSAERSDYTAIGPTVNIAARLQTSASPNTILVSSNVAHYVQPSECRAIGPLSLKGIEEKIPAFEVDNQ